ncbi:MAG: 5-oxoprolinase subunit PxpA [Pseudomonadota bacterium]
MKLNADLGESYGYWQFDADTNVMPYIDMANIACGYHAGDANSMHAAISLAKKYGVDIGAHPSYPDLQGFGRRSMRIPRPELTNMIHAQIAMLEGMAKCQQSALSYIKPHGALYNDMMKNQHIFEDVIHALSAYHTNYPVVIQALPDNQLHHSIASDSDIDVMFEAFCDRAYDASGYLVSREVKGAVLDHEQSVNQALSIIEHGLIQSIDGKDITVKADTLCVHGDNPQALAITKALRSFIDNGH